jgi:hypothetical protein
MKNLKLLPVLFGLLLCCCGCEGLEKTDLIERKEIMNIDNKSLLYELHLTGLDKYRYTYKLATNHDTIQLFETRYTDETANNITMEIEHERNRIKLLLDRPTEHQSKTVDGITYELEGTK